jgi:hypothetical protein
MNSLPQILLSRDIHAGDQVILIRFEYNQRLIELVRQISGAKWSQSKKSWYINNEVFNLDLIFNEVFR